jgi:hypothetical protein
MPISASSRPRRYRNPSGHPSRRSTNRHVSTSEPAKLPFSAKFQARALRLCIDNPEWLSRLKSEYFDHPLHGRVFRILKAMPQPVSVKTLAVACADALGTSATKTVFKRLINPLDDAERAHLLSKLPGFLTFQTVGESLSNAAKMYQQQDVEGLVRLVEKIKVPLPGDVEPQDLVSIKKLLAEPDESVKWLVENCLPTGGLSMLAGKPKVGKGTLARCLAVAVARGQQWLGRQTVRGPVIYVAGIEEKRYEVRDHFRRLGASNEPVYIRFHSAPSDPLTWLRQQIDRIRPVLVIIDALFRFIRLPEGAGKDYDAVTAALEPLLALARKTGVHILTIHHMGKGERSDPFDAILGSTAILGTVDTAMAYRRYDRYRTLQSRQRYGEDLDEITLPFNPKTGMVSDGPRRTEADAAEAGRHILDALARAGRPVTEDYLETVIEGRTQVWKKALRRLCESGEIERTDRQGKPNAKGGKGNPFHYVLAAGAKGSQVPTTPSQPGNLKGQRKETSERTRYLGSQKHRLPGSSGSQPRFSSSSRNRKRRLRLLSRNVATR